jgi:hypothetical protein
MASGSARRGAALAIAATKSSTVAARPSLSSKKRSQPRRNAAAPMRFCATRTTSAPFSYTVAV